MAIFDMLWMHALLGFIFGSLIGSFIGMASYRLPRKQSWAGRSKCPGCARTLGVLDLIPILSYFLHRGRCRQCDAKISARYPAIEIVTAILSALVLAQFGWTLLSVLGLIFVLLLMLIIVIDWETFIIPNQLVLILFLVGLAWRWARDGAWYAPFLGIGTGVMLFLTAFLAAFIVERINETESLGGGDLKLLFTGGPWVGFPMLPVLLILSGLYGVLFYLLWKKMDMPAKQSADVPFGAFPYGPAICAAMFTCVIIEDSVVKFFF